MILKVILNDCNTSVANCIQCVGIAIENTIITTIATNSYNISDFQLQALQQYSYNISNLKLQVVGYNSRQAVLQPNPSTRTTFQAVNYNSRNGRGGICAVGDGSPPAAALIVMRDSMGGSTLSGVMSVKWIHLCGERGVDASHRAARLAVTALPAMTCASEVVSMARIQPMGWRLHHPVGPGTRGGVSSLAV
jgi:hypothetical protein